MVWPSTVMTRHEVPGRMAGRHTSHSMYRTHDDFDQLAIVFQHRIWRILPQLSQKEEIRKAHDGNGTLRES